MIYVEPHRATLRLELANVHPEGLAAAQRAAIEAAGDVDGTLVYVARPWGSGILVAASGAVALVAGLASGVRCRRCGHPRHLHRHHRAGTDCSCGCRAWTLWGRRRG